MLAGDSAVFDCSEPASPDAGVGLVSAAGHDLAPGYYSAAALVETDPAEHADRASADLCAAVAAAVRTVAADHVGRAWPARACLLSGLKGPGFGRFGHAAHTRVQRFRLARTEFLRRSFQLSSYVRSPWMI